jgi:hypothetical protein
MIIAGVESKVGAERNRLAVARFPAPAHQIGRPEMPHLAFRQTTARAADLLEPSASGGSSRGYAAPQFGWGRSPNDC